MDETAFAALFHCTDFQALLDASTWLGPADDGGVVMVTRVGPRDPLWIEYPDLARSSETIVGGFETIAAAEDYHTSHPAPRP